MLGFGEYSLGGGFSWTGLDNYRRLVDDPVFWRALIVTLQYALFAVPLTLVVAVALALAVRRGARGVGFLRSVFFLPVITSLVVAGVVFRWVFSDSGPWTTVLAWVGVDTGSWLASSALVVPAVAMVGVWSRFGYGMLIILARLQDIPAEYEEAAKVDGANAWQRFWHITLPELRPALLLLAILETATSLHVFDTVYVMTGGGPGHSSYNLPYLLYHQGFTFFDFGYASAIGMAMLVIGLVIAGVQNLVIGRRA